MIANTNLAGLVIPLFLIFVRVGTCIMVMPGLSGVQVPTRIRLYIAIAISFSLYLLIRSSQENDFPNTGEMEVSQLAKMIFYEFLIGMALVLPLRFMFLALSFLGEVITQVIGLNPIPGTPVADDQSSTVLSGMFNITVTVLFFSTGLHLIFITGIARSFEIYPLGATLPLAGMLEGLSKDLSSHFQLVVRLGGPIFIYAIIANLIAGLINKLTPQIPVYFVSTPFLICGGMIFLVWIGDDIMMLFILEVTSFLDSF